MTLPVCWIAGAGDFWAEGFAPDESRGDLIIAADGGLAHLRRMGLTPHRALGDFDSLGFIPELPDVAVYPPAKDDTDMMLAVKEGLRRGFRNFALFGGLGGRLGHTLANLQTLQYLSRQGARGLLAGKDCIAAAVTDGGLSFDAGHQGYVSVFCLAEKARGVTLKGLKYGLEDGELESWYPLGVSNEFTGGPASLSVRKGTLTALWSDGRFHDLFLQADERPPEQGVQEQ